MRQEKLGMGTIQAGSHKNRLWLLVVEIGDNLWKIIISTEHHRATLQRDIHFPPLLFFYNFANITFSTLFSVIYIHIPLDVALLVAVV